MSALKPQPKRGQHAAEDHLPEWLLTKAVAAKQVWASSPYVTDTRLFKAATKSAARLYIDFSAIHFISGSSSLEVLTLLLRSKVEIYHVACLHAKVILIDAIWFSVGSQNLTQRGRSMNVEASFVSGQDSSSADVAAFFKRIHANARRISLVEITAMEKLVTPWRAKFKAIREAATLMDSQIEAKQARQSALALAARRMRKARSQLKQFLNEAEPTPRNHLTAVVRTIHHPWNSLTLNGIGKGATESLVPCDPKQDFEALFKGLGIYPRRLHRYLVIHEETGQLGFVRFGKTRWTFFANGLQCNEPLILGDHELRMTINFDWKPAKESPRNGVVDLRACDDQEKSPILASVDLAFTTTGVELGVIECTGEDPALANYLASHPQEVASAHATLKKRLFTQLTEPFVFERNLAGREALSFFGKRTKFRVQLHHLGKSVFFSIRPIA